MKPLVTFARKAIVVSHKHSLIHTLHVMHQNNYIKKQGSIQVNHMEDSTSEAHQHCCQEGSIRFHANSTHGRVEDDDVILIILRNSSKREVRVIPNRCEAHESTRFFEAKVR